MIFFFFLFFTIQGCDVKFGTLARKIASQTRTLVLATGTPKRRFASLLPNWEPLSLLLVAWPMIIIRFGLLLDI